MIVIVQQDRGLIEGLCRHVDDHAVPGTIGRRAHPRFDPDRLGQQPKFGQAATDHVLQLRVSGPITPVVQAAARYELLDFVSREPSLEETFLAQYGRGGAAEPV